MSRDNVFLAAVIVFASVLALIGLWLCVTAKLATGALRAVAVAPRKPWWQFRVARQPSGMDGRTLFAVDQSDPDHPERTSIGWYDKDGNLVWYDEIVEFTEDDWDRIAAAGRQSREDDHKRQE